VGDTWAHQDRSARVILKIAQIIFQEGLAGRIREEKMKSYPQITQIT